MSKFIVRATAEVRHSRDGKHGFQVCRLVEADGAYQSFEQYFIPARQAIALQPGDYELQWSAPKVKDERIVVYPEFVAVKQAAKAA